MKREVMVKGMVTVMGDKKDKVAKETTVVMAVMADMAVMAVMADMVAIMKKPNPLVTPTTTVTGAASQMPFSRKRPSSMVNWSIENRKHEV